MFTAIPNVYRTFNNHIKSRIKHLTRPATASIAAGALSGIDQHIPALFSEPRLPLSNRPKGKIISTPVLNGLHHSYAYASTLH